MPKQAGGNYDRVAWVYDELASMVYRGRIKRIQQFLISQIPPQASVLVLGGGTGWVLRELLTLHPLVSVDYVEPSSEMMRLTRNRLQMMADYDLTRVTLLEQTELDLPLDKQYEVVFTAFFLDLFDKKELSEVANRIDARLEKHGLWLWADFVKPQWGIGSVIGGILIRLMYAFFRWTTGLKTQRLVPLAEIPVLQTYHFKSGRSYFSGFIQGKVMQKRA